MSRRPTSSRRVRAATGVVVLSVVLVTAVSVPASAAPATSIPASPAPIPTDIGRQAAETLATYAGAMGFADDSSTTACMTGPAREWLAYRTDGVMLRTTRTAAQVRAVVADALDGTSPGEAVIDAAIGTPEIITMPGEGVAPVVHVPLRARGSTAVPVVDLARRLHRLYVTASPNYLLRPTGSVGMWPNDFPVPTSAATPTRVPATAGAGTTVFVYDTGIPAVGQGTVVPGLSRLGAGDIEVLDAEAPFGIVDRYFAGHTLAIAGVLHAVVPAATIKAAKITGSDGVPTDLTAARRTAATLHAADRAGAWPDVIVDAFGSPACSIDATLPGTGDPADELVPLGLQAAVEAAAVRDESVFVASASNTGTDRMVYPAAFDTVVAVGALDATGDLDGDAWTSPSRAGVAAGFSNYGTWVDAWAPGVGLAVPHIEGFSFAAGEPVLDGQAEVEGTSFAAPYVGGLIAEHLAAHPTWRPALVVEDLLSSGATCSGDLGSGAAVALPTFASPATSPAVAPSPGCIAGP